MTSSKNIKSPLLAVFGAAGYQQEDYIVGPMGLVTFSVELGAGVCGYVGISLFSKIKKLNLTAGFGFPALKTEIDRCFSTLTTRKGQAEMHSTSIPCPASLFPAELYVGRPQGDSISFNEGDFARGLIELANDCIYQGHGAGVRSMESLRDFLIRDGNPLPWAVFATPTRVAQAAYLLRQTGVEYERAIEQLRPIEVNMRGFTDFDNYGDGFVLDVLGYFFEK